MKTMSLVGFEYVVVAMRLPGPVSARSLLLTERKQGLVPYLVASPGLPSSSNTPFPLYRDRTPRSDSLLPEKPINEANDVFEVGFST